MNQDHKILVTCARYLAGAAGLFGILAILGRFGLFPDFTQIGAGGARTSIGSAILLLLGAGSIVVLSRPDWQGRQTQRGVTAAAATMLATSGYALLRYLLRVPDAGLILGPRHGSVSVATALGFGLLALAVLAQRYRARALSARISAVGLVICDMALVGYAFGGEALTQVMLFSAMALPTAACLAMLFAALLFVEPGAGWMRPIVQRGHAGAAFRLLMPSVLLLPPFTSGLVLWAVETKLIQPPFALALVAVVMTMVLGLIVVTTTHQLERADQLRAQLAAIVESSEDAIIGKSLDGTILSWNRGAQKLFGHAAADAIGRKIDIVLPEDRVDEEHMLLAKIRAGDHVEHYETQRRRKDGSIVDISVTLSPIRLPSGEIAGASSITRDVSENKRRDAELKRSNAELEQFAYVASHDLQEPLRMVANFVELLAARYKGKLDERADKYIGFASDGARRMQRLITDLLAYSRVGTQGKPLVTVDTAAVLARVLHGLGPMIRESGAEIEAGALPPVAGDETQLGQLFQNLISNAIKFRGEAAPRIAIAATREGQFWQFSVADNGIGIDKAHAGRIFQMFQRLHARAEIEGSGIGLALAKRIVERHGGTIDFDSAPGEGTVFRFTLEAVPEPVG